MPPPDRPEVRPSAAAYSAKGWPYLSSDPKQGFWSSEDIKHGEEFDQFVSDTLIPFVKAHPETLSGTGVARISTQIKGLTGRAYDIPYKGRPDVVLWNGGDKIINVSDVKVSTPTEKVHFQPEKYTGTPKEEGYFLQPQMYAHALRESLAPGAKASLFFAPKTIATDIIVAWHGLNEENRVEYARQIMRRMTGQNVEEIPHLSSELVPVKNITYSERPVAEAKEFQPGGTLYTPIRAASDEAGLIEKWTGFHPHRLSEFERGTGEPGSPVIPFAWRRDMRALYEIAGMLAKGARKGDFSEEEAIKELQSHMQEIGVSSFDPTRLPQRAAEKPTEPVAETSPLGFARVAYGRVKEILGAKSILTQGGRFILPDIASEKETGEMPVVQEGRLGEFRGQPTIDDVLVTPVQFEAGMRPVQPEIFSELMHVWRKSIGEGMTPRAAMRLVNERRRKLMEGMPRVGPVFGETSTAAGEALNQLAVKINQVGQERESGDPMTVQRWYEKSGGLVARGRDPSLGYDIEQLNKALPGHVSTPGRIRAGLLLEQIAKIRKRVSMAARRDYMLSAAPETGRNIISPFRMEGAPRSERGIHFNVGYTPNLPEGMMLMDAATMRQMDAQGGFVLPHQEDIPLPSGVDFTPDEEAYRRQTGGSIPLGRLGHAREIAFKAKQFMQFAVNRAFQHYESGESMLRVEGVGKVSGEQELIKSWLGNKAVGMAYEDLNKRVEGGALNIEALMPVAQAPRQELFSLVSDYYATKKRGFELLTKTLQSMGLDPYKEGLVEDYDPEEREWARKSKAAITGKRLIWGEKLDPYIIQIGRAIQQQMVKQNVRMSIPVSYEEAETYARVHGRESLGQIDWDDWRQNRNERREVTFQGAMPVGGRMFQMEKLWTGRAQATLGELQAMPPRMAERALREGGHQRQYYESLLKSATASRDPTTREDMNVVSLADLREEIAKLPSELSFVEKMAQVTPGRYVDIGGGVITPPLPQMSIMSVPSEVTGMVNPIPGTEKDVFPQEEHNAIIHYYETLVKARAGSNEEARAFGQVRDRMNRLMGTKAVAKGLVSSDVTGRMGTEGTYAFIPGARPMEVIVGEKALRELTGMPSGDMSQEALDRYVETGMTALGQRRPDVLQGVTSMPGFRIVTTAEAGRLGIPVPRNFQGMAFSQMIANRFQGDADGDQVALFLATVFKIGKSITTPGEAARRSTEEEFLERQFRFLELVTGEQVHGQRTWENYLTVEDDLVRRTGMKASELAKWMQNVGKAPKTADEFFGSLEQMNASVTTKDARQAYLVEQIAQKQRGDVFNPFVRNLSIAMKSMGMNTQSEQDTLARTSYFAYQASLDEPVSSGMRTLMGIMNSYSLRTGGEDDPTSRGRVRGKIRETLDPTMGKPPEREVDFQALPKEIIRAVLEAEEFRGFADPTKEQLNKAWHRDVATLLSSNPETRTGIAKRLEGVTRDDVTEELVNDLIQGMGGEQGFWKEAGPLTAVIGTRITNRGVQSKAPWLRGIMRDVINNPQYTNFQQTAKGRQPTGGFGFFERLATPMLAAQRLESGNIAPWVTGEKSEDEEERARGLLSDLASAGLLPTYVTETVSRGLEAFRQKSWEAMQRIRLGVGVPSLDEYDNPGSSGNLANINDEERELLEARRKIAKEERDRLDAAMKARVSGELSPEELAARFDPTAPAPTPRAQGGGGRKPPSRRPPVMAIPPEPETPPEPRLTPQTPGGVTPGESARAAGIFQEGSGIETAEFVARRRAQAKAEREASTTTGYKEPGQVPADIAAQSMGDFVKLLTEEGGDVGRAIGRVLMYQGRPKNLGYKYGGERFQEQLSIIRQRIKEGQTFGQAMAETFPPGTTEGGERYEGGVLEQMFQGKMTPAAAETFRRLESGRVTEKFIAERFAEMKTLGGGAVGPESTAENFRQIAAAAIQQKETNKYLKDFGETLQTARRHTEDFGDVLKRIQQGREAPAERKWAQEMMAAAGPQGDIQAARSLRGLFQELGFTPEQRRAVGQQIVQLREAGAEDQDPLSRAALQRSARSAMGRIFGEGDVSQIAFAAWNLQRAWRMTGGQITGRMDDYAKFLGGQQQDVAMMGGPAGFFGPAGTVRRGQVAAQRFGLSVGRAGWDIMGPVMEATSGVLGMEDPDQPSLGSYALAAGGLGLGSLFALAGGGRLASMAGLGVLGRPMTGLAENIAGGVVGRAGGLARGVRGLGETAALRGMYALEGRALGRLALRGAGVGGGLVGGALGIGLLGGELLGEAGANIGEAQGGETGASIGRVAGTGAGILGTRALLGARLAGGGAITGPLTGGIALGGAIYDETIGRQQGITAGQIVNQLLGGIDTGARLLVASLSQSADVWKDAQRTGAMWAERAEGSSREGSKATQEAAEQMKKFADYSRFGKELEARMEAIRQPMEAGTGVKVGALLAQATGMDLQTMMRPESIKAMQQLMLLPPELQQQRMGLGVGMARAAGMEWGGAGFAGTIQQAISLTPQQQLRAQFNLGQISPIGGLAQQYGVQLPALTPDLITNLSPEQRTMLTRVGSLDPVAISREATRLQGMQPQLQQAQFAQNLRAEATRMQDMTLAQQNITQEAREQRDRDRSLMQQGASFLFPETAIRAAAVGGQRGIFGAGQAIAAQMGQVQQVIQRAIPTTQPDFRSLIQVEPETLQRAGTTDVSMFAPSDWAMGQRLYGRTTAPIDTGMNLVQAQSQARMADRAYQQFQYQQQLAQLGRQQVYQLGGQIGGYDFTGGFNIEQAQLGEGARAQRRQFQLQAGTMNYGWLGRGADAFQGMGGEYADLERMGAAGLGYRQFYENLEQQRRVSGIQRGRTEEDVQRQYQRQMTGLGWQEQDLTVNFERSMTRFTQSLQDLTTNFQRGQTQFGWQRENLAFQGSQQALSFGWQMEDIDTAMRYATGRERRQLSRQRERGVVGYGMQVEQLGREGERLEERQQWAQEDFNRERNRLEERRGWAEEDFGKEKDRIDTRREWAEEDLARALERLLEQGKLDEEQFGLRAKQFEEDQKMAKLRHDESVKHFSITNGLQVKAFEDRKKQFEIESAAQAVSLIKTMLHTAEVIRLQDQIGVLTSAMSYRFDRFSEDIKDPNGKLANSLNAIVLDISGALGSAHQPYFKGHDTVFRAFERLTEAVVANVNRAVQELTSG